MDSITGIEGMNLKFSAVIEIPYDFRFIGVALDWLFGLAGVAGGVRKEADALRLAAEETLTFLINSYPDAEISERILIDFALQEGGMSEIVMTNAGPPVHLDRIPQYNPQTPSESDLDGLWYFLASEAADDFKFQNLGRDGWRVVIRKQLTGALFETKAPVVKPVSAVPVKRTPFIVRLAVPEDAQGLVDLTYDTYRYSYPVEIFYYEPRLRKALEMGEIISIVVESDGVIIGNSSFIISPQTPRCACSSSLMIRPAFRQSQAIIYLLKEIDRYLASGSMDIDVCYGSTVTTHAGSQKAGARIGFSPLGFHFAVCTIVDFRGMKQEGTERESLIICVRFTTPPTLETAFLPERHHSVMAGLLAQAGFHCRLSAEELTPIAERSKFTLEEDGVDLCAYLTAVELGKDWAESLQKKIFALKVKGIKTVIILIPAWRPVPPDLDREMGRVSAIFNGMKPLSAGECYLVYSALSDPVDFDRLLLHDPLAHALKEHCRLLYKEMTEEKPE